jgi:hypothetical protein
MRVTVKKGANIMPQEQIYTACNARVYENTHMELYSATTVEPAPKRTLNLKLQKLIVLEVIKEWLVVIKKVTPSQFVNVIK